MRGLGGLLGLAMVLTTCSSTSAFAEESAFARSGHPHTKICGTEAVGRSTRALMVQFLPKETVRANLDEAVALLGLLSPAMLEAGMPYVGFSPDAEWDQCHARTTPEFLFWRDGEDNWRFPGSKDLVVFLHEHRDSLPAKLKGTRVEGHVLFSIADIKEVRGEILPVEYRAAFDVLQAAGVADALMRRIVARLIRASSQEVPEAELLDAWAASAETEREGDILPLVKVAPVYPVDAWRTGKTGYVVVEFTVDENGRVRDVSVIEQKPGKVFGRAARKAALQFRYLPKVVNGKRVAMKGVRNRITFAIDGH